MAEGSLGLEIRGDEGSFPIEVQPPRFGIWRWLGKMRAVSKKIRGLWSPETVKIAGVWEQVAESPVYLGLWRIVSEQMAQVASAVRRDTADEGSLE